METLFFCLIVAIVSFYIGWKARERHAAAVVTAMIKQIAAEVEIEKQQNIIDVKVETHDGQFFVYSANDGSYLAHANTKASLEDMLREKFPGKAFNASAVDMQKLEAK